MGTTALTTSQSAALGAMLGVSVVAAMTLIAVLVIAYYVIYIIAFWKIFEKAGEKGWKSIIPFYNAYIQFKITWDVKYFWIVLALAIVGSLCNSMAGDDGSILTLIGSLCMLASCIIILIDYYYLSKSYGHGGGYFIGLIFLEFIFTLIIGFGSSQYIGPKGERQTIA